MTKIIKTFRFLKNITTSTFRSIWLLIKYLLGWPKRPMISAFRGYGTFMDAYITGYATEDKGLLKPDQKHTMFDNLLSMLKRYSSDEIPGADVQIIFNGCTEETTTGDNGIFKLTVQHKASGDESMHKTQWLDYNVHLKSSLSENKDEIHSKGEVLIPGKDVEYGIISDVDDTIIVSHSTRFLRKLRLMLLHNSRTRSPLPGAAAFYRALHKGSSGKSRNPVFYVSSSEWNIYDLLEDFCTYNNFPKGVFLLKELKTSIFKFWKKGDRGHQHKFRKIKSILDTYPNMPFILIGDSGQMDPVIYARIASEYGDRIKAIYIRMIKTDETYKRTIHNRISEFNVPVELISDTEEAAQHAVRIGLIQKRSTELNELKHRETIV